MSKPLSDLSQAKTCQGCGVALPPGGQSLLCSQCLWAGAAKSAMVPEEDDSLAELSELLPDFEWLGVIGRGGMGTVYKARQKRLDRLVAVKVLSEEISVESRFATRFEREAKILASLNHPHIVTIHDFGQELGLYYLVMEYVDGIDLAKLLRQGPRTIESGVRMARQLCSALVFAHERGVLHRDIKPANILVDAHGLVKIADFGLAKLGRTQEAGGTLTVPGTTMGTPRYMAPEQWEHPDDIDHRADIFAFGMIFYELLTSEVPSGMIELPSTKTSVDKRADDIVRQCLAPNPENRYRNASELETDLMALERTTSVASGSSKDDSWLRPPPVSLIEEEDDDLAVTVMDSSATSRPAMSIPKKVSKNRWLGWLVALLAVAVTGAFFVKSHQTSSSSDVRMVTLPSLKGPWWFDDMPYLIPPVRQQLVGSELWRLPQTAEEVQKFEAQVVQAVRKLSETTTDTLLSDVLEGLLKRSVNTDDLLALIPEELATADPAWQHTRANLAHSLGNVSVAEAYYRDAIRGYRAETSESTLIGLCYLDLARSYTTSGRNEDAVEAFDRAMDSVLGLEVPFFQVACLSGKADACRRFEAWEEAEQALLNAKGELENAGVKTGHPLMTYILQRFGWLYMDDWKLGDGLIAFKGAIDSRQQWLEVASDPSLFTQIRQQHDELALAMCQRYSGHADEAIASYERVRQSLNAMRQRVNRTPSAQRDWYLRYYNNSERLGDCYLFAEDGARQAVHHFHQAATDLGRELEAMKPEEAPVFRPQYGRFLAKEAVAQMLNDGDLEDLNALKVKLETLDLAGNHKALLELFVATAEIIARARRDGADVTAQVTRLEASVRTNQDKQFGRDVRELFLLACRELAPRCAEENARKLAGVITRLLPRDPVDKSVLPFLRSHFDRLIDLRVSSEEMSWGIVRDIHWAKTGSRLGEDLPEEPVVTFYLESDRGYVIRMDPDGTAKMVRIDSGHEDLEALPENEEVMRWIDSAGPTRIYWTDEGLIPPLTRENFPVEGVDEPS